MNESANPGGLPLPSLPSLSAFRLTDASASVGFNAQHGGEGNIEAYIDTTAVAMYLRQADSHMSQQQ